MTNPIEILVRDYEWIHLALGLFGHTGFFVGSIFFLPVLEPYKTIGVWLFIFGAFFMLIGYIGRLLTDIWELKR